MRILLLSLLLFIPLVTADDAKPTGDLGFTCDAKKCVFTLALPQSAVASADVELLESEILEMNKNVDELQTSKILIQNDEDTFTEDFSEKYLEAQTSLTDMFDLVTKLNETTNNLLKAATTKKNTAVDLKDALACMVAGVKSPAECGALVPDVPTTAAPVEETTSTIPEFTTTIAPAEETSPIPDSSSTLAPSEETTSPIPDSLSTIVPGEDLSSSYFSSSAPYEDGTSTRIFDTTTLSSDNEIPFTIPNTRTTSVPSEGTTPTQPYVDCELHPSDPSCPLPDCDPTDPQCPFTCDSHPEDPRCITPSICDSNPSDPDCPGYCELHPSDPSCPKPECDTTDPECPMNCDLHPSDPKCAHASCDANPSDPECVVDCILHPSNPTCV